jgi:hypothetical protein
MATRTNALARVAAPRQRVVPREKGVQAVCAECRFAQLYAVQPRAECACRGAALAGRTLFSGQPACDDARARRGDDLLLSWSAPGARMLLRRFAQIRPHLY